MFQSLTSLVSGIVGKEYRKPSKELTAQCREYDRQIIDKAKGLAGRAKVYIDAQKRLPELQKENEQMQTPESWEKYHRDHPKRKEIEGAYRNANDSVYQCTNQFYELKNLVEQNPRAFGKAWYTAREKAIHSRLIDGITETKQKLADLEKERDSFPAEYEPINPVFDPFA
jgi:hypothetical protein